MSSNNETNTGTSKVELIIDGKRIAVPENASIMCAAMEADIKIPKLCTGDHGSCRLCLVEIEGRIDMPASCTEPVAPGMIVHTTNERLDRVRRGVLELYISDLPVDSLNEAKEDFELAGVIKVVGLKEVRYGFRGASDNKGDQ